VKSIFCGDEHGRTAQYYVAIGTGYTKRTQQAPQASSGTARVPPGLVLLSLLILARVRGVAISVARYSSTHTISRSICIDSYAHDVSNDRRSHIKEKGGKRQKKAKNIHSEFLRGYFSGDTNASKTTRRALFIVRTH